MALPDNKRLLAILNNSGLQTRDYPTYQVIKSLIDNLQIVSKEVGSVLVSISGGGGGGGGGIANATYLTSTNQLGTLPNSRQLIAGTGITFDDSIGGERTINGSSGNDHVVMSDGANPAVPMNDGNGNFIYIPYTP